MHFSAPWNIATKLSTGLAVVILFALPMMLTQVDSPPELAAVVIGISVVILAISYLLAPRGYAVEGGNIEIRRSLFPVTIAGSEIECVKPLSKPDMGATMRVFGNGGLFGFYGVFYSRKLGRHKWYASRTNHLVGIETRGGGWVVISPDDPAKFVEAVGKPPKPPLPGEEGFDFGPLLGESDSGDPHVEHRAGH